VVFFIFTLFNFVFAHTTSVLLI